MNVSKAVAIFTNINSNDFTDDEKAIAIHQVVSMPTHNTIKKDDMLAVIKLLWDKLYEIEEELE